MLTDHPVVILRLPVPGLTADVVCDVGPEVHTGRVEPHEERRLAVRGGADEPLRGFDDLVVDRLHPLLGQRAGVLDPTISEAVDHPTGTEPLAEVRVPHRVRIIGVLGLLLGIEVIQIAEELIETVIGR